MPQPEAIFVGEISVQVLQEVRRIFHQNEANHIGKSIRPQPLHLVAQLWSTGLITKNDQTVGLTFRPQRNVQQTLPIRPIQGQRNNDRPEPDDKK